MRILKFYIAPAIILVSLASVARSHEFWIESDGAVFKPNSLIALSLRVGDGFPGESFPRSEEHIDKFAYLDPMGGTHTVLGSEGKSPAGYVRFKQSGVHVVSYVSRPHRLELGAEKFESYLREEGLEYVIKERDRRGESKKAGTESYSRCAKALVRIRGKGPVDHSIKALGLPYEIIPLENPWDRSNAGKLPVQVLFNSKPVKHALVLATVKPTEKGKTSKRLKLRTNAEGKVTVQIERAGVWLISSVHMQRNRQPATEDWRSYWASLCFDTRLESSASDKAAAAKKTASTESKSR